MFALCIEYRIFSVPLIGIEVQFTVIRRYGPLCGPAFSSCGGLQPSAEVFFALGAKEIFLSCPYAFLFLILYPVVPLVIVGNNHVNLENYHNIKNTIKYEYDNKTNQLFLLNNKYHSPLNVDGSTL